MRLELVAVGLNCSRASRARASGSGVGCTCAVCARAQRPTAHELLKHPFLKRAKKTAFLLDLIERYKKWKAEGGDSRDRGDSSSSSDDDDEPRCALSACACACTYVSASRESH